MQRFSTIAELREALRQWRRDGARIAFVPTMGNLHRGHLRLVEQAAEQGGRIVVSIFVNPMQFNDKNDFNAYPVTIDEDCEKLTAAGVDALFLPASDVIYSDGFEKATRVEVPGLSDILCGAHRPGHFVGVTTVVAKLFNIIQPDVALFGEKDFQQLMVIRRMVDELSFPIEVIGVATERETDGLAMSSRNGYLTNEQRDQAPLLYRTLLQAAARIDRGDNDIAAIESAAIEQLIDGGFRPEYFTVRSCEDLSDELENAQDLVIVAAAWLGPARLIDNICLKTG